MGKRLFCGLIVLCLLMALTASSSCLDSRESPEKLDLTGVRLVVWDSLQPKFPGSPDYAEGVTTVIEGFCSETGVGVEFRYAERREVLEALSGANPEAGPHLIFSNEWPVISHDLQDVSDAVDPASYMDPAALYWTREGRLLGIPSYVQWIGTAVRKPAKAAEGDFDGRTGYWTGSPAFLMAALDRPEAGWSEDTVLRYIQWVKETYGTLTTDPLLSWQYGEVDALYPVTPYLFKWLKVSTSGEETVVSVVPIRSPFGDEDFYYTVPAYLVLAADGPERAAAVELGKRLAVHLGRWAARTLGCVPASVDDMSLFNLESGFEYEERQVIWNSLIAGEALAPDVIQFLESSSIGSALAEPLAQYLSGEATLQSLEEGIRGAFGRHTKP